MNVLKPEKKLAILSALVEGCSVRATARMAGVEKKTVLRLLASVGPQCQRVLDEKMRGLHCEAVECDELWTYIGMKQANVKDNPNPELGDAYTFVSIDPATKLVLNFTVGKRTSKTTNIFIADLSKRIEGSVQLSTDGWPPYIQAIQRHFGNRADYAQVIKLYGHEASGRYSPAPLAGVQIQTFLGVPEPSKICTSYVERNNLTIRMHLRRFTRLTNAFSRKLSNLKAALSLWFWYYNFCRIHKTLRTTPAMAAGLTDRVLELRELAA
jgi:IS1 family transposase